MLKRREKNHVVERLGDVGDSNQPDGEFRSASGVSPQEFPEMNTPFVITVGFDDTYRATDWHLTTNQQGTPHWEMMVYELFANHVLKIPPVLPAVSRTVLKLRGVDQRPQNVFKGLQPILCLFDMQQASGLFMWVWLTGQTFQVKFRQ